MFSQKATSRVLGALFGLAATLTGDARPGLRRDSRCRRVAIRPRPHHDDNPDPRSDGGAERSAV